MLRKLSLVCVALLALGSSISTYSRVSAESAEHKEDVSSEMDMSEIELVDASGMYTYIV